MYTAHHSVSPASAYDHLGGISRRSGCPNHGTISSLLTIIFEHKGYLKMSSVNLVLRLWSSQFQQFESFVTKISDEDRDILLIMDPKIIQARIHVHPKKKALQATAEEKVSLGQLGIRQGSVAEANSNAKKRQRMTSPQPSPSWRR